VGLHPFFNSQRRSVVITKYLSTIRNQTITVPVMGFVRCSECGGSGKIPGKNKEDCTVCKGEGQVWGRMPIIGVDGSHKILNGERVYLDKTLQFRNIRSSFTFGMLSEFVVYKNEPRYNDTPPEVIAELERLCKDPNSDVCTEDQFDKQENPARYEEKKRREAVEKKLEKAEEEKEKAVKEAVEQAEKIRGKALKDMQEKLARMERELKEKG
jgi:hypothetical protein